MPLNHISPNFGGYVNDPFSGLLVSLGMPVHGPIPDDLPLESIISNSEEENRELRQELNLLFHSAVLKNQGLLEPKEKLVNFLRYADRLEDHLECKEQYLKVRASIESAISLVLKQDPTANIGKSALVNRSLKRLSTLYGLMSLDGLRDWILEREARKFLNPNRGDSLLLPVRVQRRLAVLEDRELDWLFENQVPGFIPTNTYLCNQFYIYLALDSDKRRKAWSERMIAHCDTPDKLRAFVFNFYGARGAERGHFPDKAFFEKVCEFQAEGRHNDLSPGTFYRVPRPTLGRLVTYLDSIKERSLLDYTYFKGVLRLVGDERITAAELGAAKPEDCPSLLHDIEAHSSAVESAETILDYMLLDHET